MDGFARFLPAAVRRYVLNRTGLDGHFDGEFDFTAEIGPPPPPPGIPDPYDRTNFQSIFTVLQEQLGLRLESIKGPVDVFVIDRVERLNAEDDFEVAAPPPPPPLPPPPPPRPRAPQ